jgi:integrase
MDRKERSDDMRREVPTQYPDVSKILILNADGKWIEPIRGNKFKARRYQRRSDKSLERIKRSFKTLAEAKVFRLGAPIDDRSETTQTTPSAMQASPETMIFEELLENWIGNWLPSVDLATQLRYRKYTRHFTFFAKMKVVDIEPSQIDAWIAYLKRPEYLASCHSTRCSYEHEFKVLRAILSYYSSRCNRSYRLPFLRDHRKMLKVKEGPVTKKDLTVDQFDSFLIELKVLCWDTKWESIYYLAVMQYAIYGRIQETAALHVEDFDLRNNRLEIKRKVQWMRAKGFENRVVAGSKTNGGKIFSPIPELAVQVLREWQLRSGVRSGLLFTIEGGLIEYRQIQYKYDQALRNAKLPFSATHILRHAALAEAYSTSSNILAVQRLAGHKSLKATEKYAKVRDEQVAEVQRGMDVKLSSVLRGI